MKIRNYRVIVGAILMLLLIMAPDCYAKEQIKHDKKFADYSRERGIDVSEWQGEIDWKKVAKDNIDFAIIRVAHRDPETGKIKADKKAKKNLKEAKAAGLKIGAYIYSQAISTEEGKEEAEFADSVIRKSGVELDLPLVMDFEYMSSWYGDSGRLFYANLSRTAATNVCTSFFEVAEEKGYEPMIYGNNWMLANAVDAEKLSKSGEIWIAEYENKVSYKGTYNYWQYTASGSVDGINGNVDIDYRYFEKKYFITHLFSVDPPKGITSETELDSVTLSWKENPEASGYYIEKYDPISTKYICVKELEGSAKTSWTDTKVNAEAAYTYRIQAYKVKKNLKSISDYSEDYTVMTKDAIDGIVLTDDVYVRREGKMSADIISLFDRKTPVRIIGGYGDWYRVCQDEYDINGYIYKDFVASDESLKDKTKISLKTKNFHSVVASWAPIEGAEGYLIQKYDEDSEEFVDLALLNDPDASSYMDGSLEAREKASYRVAGITMIKGYPVPGEFSDAKKGKAASPKAAKLKKTVNILKAPEEGAKKLKKLKAGESIRVSAIYGDYYKVIITAGSKEKTGYVLSKYVTFK